jgi:hypothetical protein
MNATRDHLVDDYLDRLDAALGGLPRERRREIVEEIAEHITAARKELAPGDEAALRTLLDRLGDPEQIAADASEDAPVRLQRGWLETLAIVLLLVGGFAAGVGWLAGVVLLWLSNVWTTRDKLIGTLVVPGGLVLPLLLMGVAINDGGTACTTVLNTSTTPVTTATSHCTSTGGSSHILWFAVLVALVVAPILSAVYLARRSRRFELA